jgi:hypothetical protein
MNNTGPIPQTGPKFFAPIDRAAMRDRFRSLDSRIKYLEKNRTPTPVLMHTLGNAPQLQIAQNGHAPVWSTEDGNFQPSPVLAEMTFNMPGPLVLSTSDPVHARYPCNVVSASADLTTFSSDVTFELLINGTVIQSFTMTSASTGSVVVPTNNALHSYSDLVTVATTSIGTGNVGLVVHIELAVDVDNLATG